MIFACVCSALLGVIMSRCGLGWVNKGNFNPLGAIVNLVGVILIVYVSIKLGL